MRRIFALLMALMIFCPIIANADSFFEALSSALDGMVISYAEIGSRLIIVMDYDQITNRADDDNDDNDVQENIIDQYSEELKKYTSIVYLLEKEGLIYLGVEIPLEEGVRISEESLPLMSAPFIQDNMKFGQ